MPDDTANGLLTSPVGIIAGIIGIGATLAAVIKSLASAGTTHAATTNAGLFTLVNNLQGTVNTLIGQQAATALAQNEQAEKLGRLSGRVEHLQGDLSKTEADLKAAMSDLLKEVTAHGVTRTLLAESQTNLAAVTEDRDELKLTLDEKVKAEGKCPPPPTP